MGSLHSHHCLCANIPCPHLSPPLCAVHLYLHIYEHIQGQSLSFLIIIIITTTYMFKLPPLSYYTIIILHITTGDPLVILFSNLAPSWPSSTTNPSLASFNRNHEKLLWFLWIMIVISVNYDCDFCELWLWFPRTLIVISVNCDLWEVWLWLLRTMVEIKPNLPCITLRLSKTTVSPSLSLYVTLVAHC